MQKITSEEKGCHGANDISRSDSQRQTFCMLMKMPFSFRLKKLRKRKKKKLAKRKRYDKILIDLSSHIMQKESFMEKKKHYKRKKDTIRK